MSVAESTKTDLEAITETAVALSKKSGKFRVSVNRADKTFPMNSVETAKYLGGKILNSNPNLTVDLFEPVLWLTWI